MVSKMKAGDMVRGRCKCGNITEYPLQQFADGTLHAFGKCPGCGLKNYKTQIDLPVDVEVFGHLINKVRFSLSRMVDMGERDEAVAMLERVAADFRREEND